jgi:hypothetical protein
MSWAPGLSDRLDVRLSHLLGEEPKRYSTDTCTSDPCDGKKGNSEGS